MVERAQQAAFTIHFEIACRPDGRGADITGENGIFIGKMTDLLRQILRVNGFIAGFSQIVEPFSRVAIVLQRLIEEVVIGFLFQQRQQRLQRRFNIAHQRHVDLTVCADAAGVDVDLDNFRVGWVEGAIGELGTQQDQGIGVHHGVEARREANQPGHAHIVRVVVLHVLFAAQGVDDGGFNFGCELHQFWWAPAQPLPHMSAILLE